MKYFVFFILFFFNSLLYSQLLIGNQWTHKSLITRGGSSEYKTYIEDAIFLKYVFPKRKEKSYYFSLKSEFHLEKYRSSKKTNILIYRYPILFQLNANGLNSDLFAFAFEGGYIYSSISAGNNLTTKGSSHGFIAGVSFNFKLENKITAIFGYRRILDLKTSLAEPHLFGESNFFVGFETDIIALYKDLIQKKRKKKHKK